MKNRCWPFTVTTGVANPLKAVMSVLKESVQGERVAEEEYGLYSKRRIWRDLNLSIS